MHWLEVFFLLYERVMKHIRSLNLWCSSMLIQKVVNTLCGSSQSVVSFLSFPWLLFQRLSDTLRETLFSAFTNHTHDYSCSTFRHAQTHTNIHAHKHTFAGLMINPDVSSPQRSLILNCGWHSKVKANEAERNRLLTKWPDGNNMVPDDWGWERFKCLQPRNGIMDFVGMNWIF